MNTRKALLAIACVLPACMFHSNPPHILDDAGLDAELDIAPDAATLVTLSESSSIAVELGHSVSCGGTQTTRDNGWYRTFRPAEFGVTGVLHITRFNLTSEESKGASVTVRVFDYTGTFGDTTIDLSKLTQLAVITQSVPDNLIPQNIVVPITADIAAGGLFVAQIAAVDTFSGTGVNLTRFHAGANSVGQSAPSYFESATCGMTPPASQSGFDLILTVDGLF